MTKIVNELCVKIFLGIFSWSTWISSTYSFLTLRAASHVKQETSKNKRIVFLAPNIQPISFYGWFTFFKYKTEKQVVSLVAFPVARNQNL